MWYCNTNPLLLFHRLGRQALDEKKCGHTAKALYCMKRKKSLQDILEKRLKSMETMDTVLIKIESSQDDLQVYKAEALFISSSILNIHFLI